MIDDEMSIAKDIYMHHFDDDVKYPDVLKVIIVGIQKGAELKERRIEELEKENAELKEKLNFSTQYYQGEKAKVQLTKAKEIIKNLISQNRKLWVYSDIREEAEQFLKQA